MPAMSPRLLRLAAIGCIAGAFSGLFGVGGGTVIVPLLILWFAFEEREATGTSLAAIVLIAALAAGAHGLYGNVHPLKGAIVALPALVGVVAGTAAQQRIPQRAVSGGFAILLVVSAAVLIF
jgi:uncharacterized protein